METYHFSLTNPLVERKTAIGAEKMGNCYRVKFQLISFKRDEKPILEPRIRKEKPEWYECG